MTHSECDRCFDLTQVLRTTIIAGWALAGLLEDLGILHKGEGHGAEQETDNRGKKALAEDSV